jgi:hypothetical protein
MTAETFRHQSSSSCVYRPKPPIQATSTNSENEGDMSTVYSISSAPPSRYDWRGIRSLPDTKTTCASSGRFGRSCLPSNRMVTSQTESQTNFSTLADAPFLCAAVPRAAAAAAERRGAAGHCTAHQVDGPGVRLPADARAAGTARARGGPAAEGPADKHARGPPEEDRQPVPAGRGRSGRALSARVVMNRSVGKCARGMDVLIRA